MAEVGISPLRMEGVRKEQGSDRKRKDCKRLEAYLYEGYRKKCHSYICMEMSTHRQLGRLCVQRADTQLWTLFKAVESDALKTA